MAEAKSRIKDIYKVLLLFISSINGEQLFLWAYAVLVLGYALSSTMFSIPSVVFLACKYIPMAVLAVKIIFYDHIKQKELLIYAVILGIAVACMLSSGTKEVLIWMLTLLAAKGVNFEKLLKVWLLVIVTVVTLTFIGSLIGVVINLQYVKDFTGSKYADIASEVYSGTRNSFGIVFPTDFAAYIFNIMVVYFYLMRNRIKMQTILAGFIICFVLYRYTHARLDTGCCLILCAGYFVYLMAKNSRSYAESKYVVKRNVPKVFCFSMPVMAAVITALTYGFDEEKVWLRELNLILSNRLLIAQKTLQSNGIRYFGQFVELIGFGGTTKQPLKEYNYVDCSYLNILLLYGIIVYIFVIIVSVAVNIKYIDDVCFIFSIAMIALNAVVAHHLMAINYTAMLFALFAEKEREKNDESRNFRLRKFRKGY